MTINADNTYQLIQRDPSGVFLFVNNDLKNPVYISQAKPVTTLDTQISPQASVGLTGLWYVSTLSTSITVQCFVLPGGTTWSDPIGVQISLNTLGLALDSSVTALPGQIQTMGAPPYIPNMSSHFIENAGPGGSPYTIYNAVQAGRIWYCHLSFAGSSNASHSGNDQMYATLRTQSGNVLVPIEIAVGDAASADSGDGDLSIGGLQIAKGDAIVLDVNAGKLVTNVIFRASCVALVSTP